MLGGKILGQLFIHLTRLSRCPVPLSICFFLFAVKQCQYMIVYLCDLGNHYMKVVFGRFNSIKIHVPCRAQLPPWINSLGSYGNCVAFIFDDCSFSCLYFIKIEFERDRVCRDVYELQCHLLMREPHYCNTQQTFPL